MNYTNVVEQQNSIIIEDVKDFNIKQILECGQCFRWERITDTNYIIVAFRRVIEVVQEGNKVIIYNTNMKDFNEIWKSYFDLDRDYGVIKEELCLRQFFCILYHCYPIQMLCLLIVQF